MKRFGLTMRQLRVLNFIRDRLAVSEVSPTLVEIGEACEIKAKSNVHYIIRRLKERGYVDSMPTRARSLRLTDKFTNSSASREAKPVLAASPIGSRPS